MQFLGATQLVEAHPRVDEALERRSHVSFAAKVCVASLGGQAPPSRVRDPRLDDRPVPVDLVQVAAAQALVAQRADAFQQQLVGGFERRERLSVLALGGQRAVVPPPHMRGRESRAQRSAFTRTIQVGGSPRGIERGLALTLHQVRPCTGRSGPGSGSSSPPTSPPGRTPAPARASPRHLRGPQGRSAR